jgi:hypothetical protein
MAATSWELYNRAKKKIGNGTISLAGAFKIQLHNSASNASALTISKAASVSNEISATGTYVAGGKAMTTVAWTVGASAKQYKFDTDDVIWTASGAAMNNIKFGVIRNSTSAANGHVLCKSKLTTAQFTLATNNILTIQMNASGIFTMA